MRQALEGNRKMVALQRRARPPRCAQRITFVALWNDQAKALAETMRGLRGPGTEAGVPRDGRAMLRLDAQRSTTEGCGACNIHRVR